MIPDAEAIERAAPEDLLAAAAVGGIEAEAFDLGPAAAGADPARPGAPLPPPLHRHRRGGAGRPAPRLQQHRAHGFEPAHLRVNYAPPRR